MYSKILLAFAALASMASAIPTPVELAPRCGTTIYPSNMQVFSEASPNTAFPNSVTTPGSGRFTVSQDFSAGAPFNRILQAVEFSNIPAGSYGCSLGFNFPNHSSLSETQNAVMNVTTLAKGHSNAIVAGNTLTYNDLFANGEQDIGLFGTVGPFLYGQSVVVNSESCPTDVNGGGNLAFLFSIASWIGAPAEIAFDESTASGVFLTFNC